MPHGYSSKTSNEPNELLVHITFDLYVVLGLPVLTSHWLHIY